MIMANIASRTGIRPTSLAFRASVLTITSSGLLNVTTLYCLRGQWRLLHSSTWNCKSLMFIITYRQWCYIYTEGRFYNYIACTGTSVMEMMIIRNTVPRVGIETPSLAPWASVLTNRPPRLPNVTTLPTPTCLSGSLPKRSMQTTTIILVCTSKCWTSLKLHPWHFLLNLYNLIKTTDTLIFHTLRYLYWKGKTET